eukprot:scaffold16752_cov85-Cyclotella_meneghiniana.AAC.9
MQGVTAVLGERALFEDEQFVVSSSYALTRSTKATCKGAKDGQHFDQQSAHCTSLFLDDEEMHATIRTHVFTRFSQSSANRQSFSNTATAWNYFLSIIISSNAKDRQHFNQQSAH